MFVTECQDLDRLDENDAVAHCVPNSEWEEAVLVF